MRRLFQTLFTPVSVPARHYFWGGFLAVVFTGWVMDTQLGHRWDFAGADLRRDVMERWGAPIDQPAPSARFVESGAVFSTLEALSFDAQQLTLNAGMSYRKRGLVHFSGFEFGFDGTYRLTNPEIRPIDAVFVFPIQSDRNRILLSDLEFSVDGEPESIPLHSRRDKLVWTGRIEPNASVVFRIRFRGQGLDRFRYVLDPALEARNVELTVEVTGGETYDYPPGVVPAHIIEAEDGRVRLQWKFDALESGVPIGLLLPSETSFDEVIKTMARRAWATYALFFALMVVLVRVKERRLARTDAYLVSAQYAFFFVLLPYLAAYMNFYVAFTCSAVLVGALLQLSLRRITDAHPLWCVAGIVSLLLVPCAAVVSQQHTGLIYCIEILAGLAVLSMLMGRSGFRSLVQDVSGSPLPAVQTEIKDEG